MPRRVVDRGPLLKSEARAKAIAEWLRRTGCYEKVAVETEGGKSSTSSA